MGEIGYNADQFLHDLKLWQIISIIRGYRRRERATWESTRWQTFCILCALGSKDIHTPQDLVSFPWENTKREEISEEEIADLQRIIKEENSKVKNDSVFHGLN